MTIEEIKSTIILLGIIEKEIFFDDESWSLEIYDGDIIFHSFGEGEMDFWCHYTDLTQDEKDIIVKELKKYIN